MDALYALTQSGRPWAAQRAAIAIQMAESYNQGAMSADEFKELLEDLVRTDVLDREADDMETKAMLVAGIYGLMQIV